MLFVIVILKLSHSWSGNRRIDYAERVKGIQSYVGTV